MKRVICWLIIWAVGPVLFPLGARLYAATCPQKISPKVVLIVDPVSTSGLLAPELKKRGIECIFIQSREFPSVVVPPLGWERNFLTGIRYNGEWGALSEFLSTFSILGVVPGLDSSVALADQISESLGGEVSTNGTLLSESRFDKWSMGQRVSDAGLRSVPQFKSNKLDEITGWIERRPPSNKYIVLKPPRSAGTDDVFVRRTDDVAGIREAFGIILGKRNLLGHINEFVLVQEFIRGEEYIVDTVSLEGVTRLTMIWKYHLLHREDGSIIFDRVELLPPHGVLQDKLIGYATKVLEALGIKNGPAHFEIYVPENEGKVDPVLLEMGARMGGGLSEISEYATGVDIVKVLADTFTDRAKFFREASIRYEFNKHALIVGINSRAAGSRFLHAGAERLKTLPSFLKFIPYFADRTLLPKTTSIASTPARVWLTSEDASQVRLDHLRLRSWEETVPNFLIAPPRPPELLPHFELTPMFFPSRDPIR